MKKEEFYENLLKATEVIYKFTCEIVTNTLPKPIRYNVKIDSNFREGLEEGETTFPEVKKLNQTSKAVTAPEVIEILWMDYAIPEWINIQVEDYDDNFTYLSLECCGRYSKLDKHLYHKHEGYQPFHALSPALPPFAMEGEKIARKFDLYWNKNN